MEFVDAQVHLPRLVTNWRAGHPRTTDEDAPEWFKPAMPLLEVGAWDLMLTASLTAMDAAGVNGAVVDEWYGMDSDGYMAPNIKTASGVRRYPSDFATYAAARYPERFTYDARVDPLDPDIDELVADHKATPGMGYLRIDPLPWTPGQVERFQEGGYSPVFEAARRHALPIAVWIQPDGAPYLESYLQQFPDVTVLLDHATPRASYDEAMFAFGRRYPNLALKWDGIAAEPYPYQGMWPNLLRAVENYGPERVMWASDWSGRQNQQTWAQSYGWVLEIPELSDVDKEWILGKSLRTTLRWPALPELAVGEGKYLDCATEHGSMRISGQTDEEYLANMHAHFALWHPRKVPDPDMWLVLARS
jgi:L-fuconolactonase